jgi:hypothetical protein
MSAQEICDRTKYRSYNSPAHMGCSELSRYDPNGDARTPISQKREIGVTRAPMRQKRHEGRWQDCR